MPLYEYQCGACGHRFEAIQKFADAPLDTCPKCGGAIQKLQSAPAFHLKGTGWYITDYAKKDSSTAAKSDAEAKSAESKGADSKGAESKTTETKETAASKGEKAETKKTDTKTEAAPAAKTDKS
jgi:putative FmdB family regulatory protein